jgi:hypothetical protein
MSEAAQKKPSSGKDNDVKDDAIITSPPVYKQLSSFSSVIFFDFSLKDFYKLMRKNMQFKIYYIILLMDFDDNQLD